MSLKQTIESRKSDEAAESVAADGGVLRHDGIIKALAGERFTPFTLARKLKAKVILESSSFQAGRERYSILLVREAFKVVQLGRNLYLERDGKRYTLRTKAKDILDVLLHFARQQPALHQDLPLPAGGVGYLSYEFSRFCDTIRFKVKDDPLDLPDAGFLFGHVFIVFDHYTDIIYLIGMNYREHEIDLQKAIEETEQKLNDLDFNYMASGNEGFESGLSVDEDERDRYLAGVERVKREIVAGNLLQGVLSRRLNVETELPALEAYKNLRSTNPSPYLFYLDFDGYQLFGSSPEVHVKAKGGNAFIRPLAGTRRRGSTSEEDVALEKELLADQKERAEHLMLVDLARNDLGRICTSGSVKVETLMDIERYSHVMHIVSHVDGALKEGADGTAAIRATFPAGTVSGAPKIRAIEVIDDIETLPRRFYAGLVGYVEPDGGIDTCITIRSGLKKGNLLVLQAGAGVVYDSTPEREYEETAEKLRALAGSVGLEV